MEIQLKRNFKRLQNRAKQTQRKNRRKAFFFHLASYGKLTVHRNLLVALCVARRAAAAVAGGAALAADGSRCLGHRHRDGSWGTGGQGDSHRDRSRGGRWWGCGGSRLGLFRHVVRPLFLWDAERGAQSGNGIWVRHQTNRLCTKWCHLFMSLDRYSCKICQKLTWHQGLASISFPARQGSEQGNPLKHASFFWQINSIN